MTLPQITLYDAEQLQTVRELIAIADKYTFPRLLMLAVTKQESDWRPNANNAADPQGSLGPFQINQAAHPGTALVATNAWYDYGYPTEIRPRWEATFADLDGVYVWETTLDRGAFIERFAPAAQGSISWPPGLGATQYAAAVAALEAVS